MLYQYIYSNKERRKKKEHTVQSSPSSPDPTSRHWSSHGKNLHALTGTRSSGGIKRIKKACSTSCVYLLYTWHV